IDAPYTWFYGLRGAPGSAVMLAGSPVDPPCVVRYDAGRNALDVIRRSTQRTLPPDPVSVAEPLAVPSQRGRTPHAFYHRPPNPPFRGMPAENPPLLVRVHGGPTGFTTSVLSLTIQFWTSRGFAVLDVNYGGSAGFGRAYREALRGNWGIV